MYWPLPCLLFALSITSPVVGQERLLTLDTERSRIEIHVGATLHAVTGTAPLESGEIRFDLEAGRASGRIVVDATAIETGNERRDRAMHRTVLESERYPRITLRVESISGGYLTDGSGQVVVDGALEIGGDEHALSFPVDLDVDGTEMEAATVFAVPYVEWGLKDPSRFLLRVKKVAEITIRAVGTLEPGAGG